LFASAAAELRRPGKSAGIIKAKSQNRLR